MLQNKTILERIGISQRAVNKWKKSGLKVTYPIRKRRKFFARKGNLKKNHSG